MHRPWFAALLLAPALCAASPECPREFSEFLSSFEKDESFQVLRTKEPITYWHVDRDDPEMKMKKQVVPKAKRKDCEPYPTREYRTRLKIQQKLESTSPSVCTVSLRVPDSDMYSVDFKFLKSKTGWFLVEVRNNSL
jgi:hypothetical protein